MKDPSVRSEHFPASACIFSEEKAHCQISEQIDRFHGEIYRIEFIIKSRFSAAVGIRQETSDDQAYRKNNSSPNRDTRQDDSNEEENDKRQ